MIEPTLLGLDLRQQNRRSSMCRGTEALLKRGMNISDCKHHLQLSSSARTISFCSQWKHSREFFFFFSIARYLVSHCFFRLRIIYLQPSSKYDFRKQATVFNSIAKDAHMPYNVYLPAYPSFETVVFLLQIL